MSSAALKELLEGKRVFSVPSSESRHCTGFVGKDCAESEYPSELNKLLSDTAKTGVVRWVRSL